MKYVCNTQGCPKEHIVYEHVDWEGSEPLDCQGCGETCAVVPDPEPAPKPALEFKPGWDLEAATLIIAGDVRVRMVVDELWQRAFEYTAAGGMTARELTIAVVREVLAATGYRGTPQS